MVRCYLPPPFDGGLLSVPIDQNKLSTYLLALSEHYFQIFQHLALCSPCSKLALDTECVS